MTLTELHERWRAQEKQDKRNDEGEEKAETASDDNERGHPPQLARHHPGRPPRRGRSLLNNTGAMGKSSHRPRPFSQIVLHCRKMFSMIHEGAPMSNIQKFRGQLRETCGEETGGGAAISDFIKER